MWKRCSSCKEPVALGALYWVCNVSTCNRKRTALQFCSVSCWDAHLPIARHRDAWAEERRAPETAEAAESGGPQPEPKAPAKERTPRRVLPPPTRAPGPRDDEPTEVLIVASRLKDFVKSESGFNTSERVLGPLSEIVREVCLRAIENARADGRKTLLERDIPDA